MSSGRRCNAGRNGLVYQRRWTLLLWALCLLTLKASLAQAVNPTPDLSDPTVQAKVRELYTQARFHILDGRYEQALEAIRQCLILSPYAKEVVCLEGAVLEVMGRRGEAVTLYENLLRTNPQAYAYLHFDLAYLYNREKRYDEALAQFKEAERVDFKRGVRERALLLMKLRRYKEAEQELARLPADDPNVKYLQAQSHFYQKHFKQARKLIGEALAMGPDPRLAKDLKGLFAQVEAAARAARPWRSWLTLLAGYDDNVFRDPLTDNPALQQPREEGDFFWLARAVYRHRLLEGESWALFATAGFMNKSYLQLGESDFLNLSGSVSWRWQGAGWMLHLPYHYSYYFAGSSHRSRLQQHTLFPSLTWQMSDNFATNFYGILQRRLYISDESNVYRWGLQIVHFYYLGALTKYLRLSYGAYQDRADDGISGFTNYEITIGGGRPIVRHLSFDAGLTYAYYDHDTRNEQALRDAGGALGVPFDRRDHQFRFALQLFYRPTPRFQLVLAYFLTNNDSNLSGEEGFDPYNFRQNVINLMAIWSL